MHTTKAVLSWFILASGVFLATLPAHADMVPEVWFGLDNEQSSWSTIQRRRFDGAPLATFWIETRTGASAVVGDEVWLGHRLDNHVYRFAFDGVFLGTYEVVGFSCMAVVGNEVWFGLDNEQSSWSTIRRISFDGTPLPSITIDTRAGAMAVVGDEVWLGHRLDNHVYRFAFDGTFLGTYETMGFSCLAVVGNEVWFGMDNEQSAWSIMPRLRFDGTPLATFWIQTRAAAMAVVGDEVWLGHRLDNHAYRFAFDGTPLGTYDVPGGCSAMAVVRECGAADFDSDGIPDACDPDIDGDGVPNPIDPCDDTPPTIPPELIGVNGMMLGDMDGNCVVDGNDIQLFVEGLLAP